MDNRLPWADLPCTWVKMLKSDIWGFGPTLLKKGKLYMLPTITANDLIERGTAVKIIEEDNTNGYEKNTGN